MKELEALIGKTIYILGNTIEQSMEYQGTLTPFQNAEEIENFMKTVPSVSMGEPTLLHGVLTRAVSIPEKVAADVDIILIIPFATVDHDSYIKKFSNLTELVVFIELLVTDDGSGYEDDSIPEDLIEELADIDPQKIDDLYILYGYEIELFYTYDKEEIDDSILTAAKKAFKDIESIQ